MVAASLVILLTISSYGRAEALVGRLGGPEYAAREHVGRDLVKLGRYSLPALRRGQSNADLEIAERCKRLLPLAEVEAVRQRVAHILAVPPLPPPEDLPRLKRFLSITGDTREARELYVDMFQAHVRVLEDVEWGGDKAGAVFWKAIDQMFKPPPDDDLLAMQLEKAPHPRPVVTRALVALFLVLSADPALKPYPCHSARFLDFPILTSEAAKDAIAGSDASPAMQKLLFAWLVGPRNFESAGAEANRVREGFRLLVRPDRRIGRPVALKIALDTKQWHVARAAALVALMQVGESEDVKSLSPLVTDSTFLGASSDESSCVLGDVALATCVKLSGQSLADYGFTWHKGADINRAVALDFGFSGPTRRSLGRQRWNEWASRTLSDGGKR